MIRSRRPAVAERAAHVRVAIACLCGLVLLFARPSAQEGGPVLAVQGERFTVDGSPRFLILVSYFDGLHQAATPAGLARLRDDLSYLRDVARVDGLRVMVNWCEGPCLRQPDPLFDAAPGQPLLRPGPLRSLEALLEAASRRGLVVDVTFYNLRSGGRPMPVERYASAILETATAIKPYRNALFDLQSEFDCKPSGVTAADLRRIRDAVLAPAVDPARLVTASPCAADPASAGRFFSGQDADGRAFSAATYHDPRQAVPDPRKTWFTREAMAAVVEPLRQGMRRAVLPIYFQEPTAWAGDGPADDTTPGHFAAAVRHAKMAGAAAWTFHQRAGFDLSERSFVHRLRHEVANGRAGLAELEALRDAADAAAWGAGGGGGAGGPREHDAGAQLR